MRARQLLRAAWRSAETSDGSEGRAVSAAAPAALWSRVLAAGAGQCPRGERCRRGHPGGIDLQTSTDPAGGGGGGGEDGRRRGGLSVFRFPLALMQVLPFSRRQHGIVCGFAESPAPWVAGAKQTLCLSPALQLAFA